MKPARLVFFVLLFFVFFTPRVFASIDDFVISEIMYDPQGLDTDREWVEAMNNGSEPVTIVGGSSTTLAWKFDDGSKRVFASGAYQGSMTIGIGEYFIVTPSGTTFKTTYPNYSGTILVSSAITLVNTSATLGFRIGSAGELKAAVTYQSSWGAKDNAKTLEKISLSGPNDSSNWIESVISGGTPGSAYGSVIPTPTFTPTPTLVPTPTPTPTPTATPTATPVPTVTPTPTVVQQISFSVPLDIVIGQAFDVSVSLSSFKANVLYYIKASIGKDSSSMTDGRTLGADNATWLAWNASWSKMPQTKTDGSGVAAVTLSVKTDDDVETGNYQMKIRIKEVDGSESVDSAAKTIIVLTPADSPTATPTVTPVPTPKSTSTSSSSAVGKIKGSIKTIKQLSNGSLIEAEGLVSVPFGVLGSNYFYLDDGEAGIMVKSENKPILKLGQRVRVASTIEESYGERYIKTSDIAIINNSEHPPLAKLIRASQINEDLEGKLTSVYGRIFETAGKVFWINDAFGDIKIYIKDSTGIKLSRKKVGDYVRATGILSQWGFDDDEKPNYRLLPRFQGDVVISSAPIGGEVGKVLGATTFLPKTGISLFELPGVIWEIVRLHLLNLLQGLTFLR